MFSMAYQQYGNYCYYCGKKLLKTIRTMDHKIPIMYGGISILPNLVPCCTECNELKSNLDSTEFKKWISMEDEMEKKRYRLRCIGEHEKECILRGTCLSCEWFEQAPAKILAEVNIETAKGKKYKEAEEFLFKYGKFQRPIVISANSILLDGFITMWLAKNEQIDRVPTIKLENVFVK